MLSLPEEGSKTASETSCFMKNYPMEKIQKRKKEVISRRLTERFARLETACSAVCIKTVFTNPPTLF
jgi:uncharacterized Fe-S cluster-containing MiaB family protein